MRQMWFNGFLHLAGPITFGLFLFWLSSLLPFVRERWSKREFWLTMGISLFASTLVFSAMQVGFKVLSDETNLLSVANMLVQFGMASNTEQWVYYYHTYHPLDFSVPSRPIFFPMLTAVVHFTNEMRSWSPFVVNFFALAGIFFLFIRMAKRQLGNPWVGLLAILMSPVLLIVGTSAGFDLVSLFFGFVSFVFWRRWQENGEERELHSLVATLLCFASVRYESIVILPLFFAVHWSAIKILRWRLFLYLFFLLPLVVQRVITWGSFENPPGVPAFSPAHLVAHLPDFFRAFFWNTNGVYPVPLHWLGIIALYWVVRDLRKNLFPMAYLGFLLLLLLSHHFGFAGHPTQVRLFLPLSFALASLSLLTLKKLEIDSRWSLVVFALLTFHHLRYALADPLTTQLTMTREVRHIRDFLQKASPEDLFVYDRPGQLSALGFSAISHNYFEANKEKFVGDVKRRLYQNLYFIDRPRYADTIYEMSPLKKIVEREHQLSPEERLRISRWDRANL
jgi:hypothetical protein